MPGEKYGICGGEGIDAYIEGLDGGHPDRLRTYAAALGGVSASWETVLRLNEEPTTGDDDIRGSDEFTGDQ